MPQRINCTLLLSFVLYIVSISVETPVLEGHSDSTVVRESIVSK